MPTETQISEEQATTAAPETKSLPEVVNQIQGDSRVEPQMYLDEAKVPHGGE
jgi:hypothetical protein